MLRAHAATMATPAEDRGEDLTPSQHPADVASDLLLRQSMLGAERFYRRDLEQVEAALERLGEGTYGSCVDCGREIPLERLAALPHAARCVACELHAGRSRG